MPVIGRFYGIAIVMYFNDHNPPHCHSKYGGYEAIYDFGGRVLNGALPPRADAFVREWISQRKMELMTNWEKAQSGQPLDYIAPLE
jgi:hypothetical protein